VLLDLLLAFHSISLYFRLWHKGKVLCSDEWEAAKPLRRKFSAYATNYELNEQSHSIGCCKINVCSLWTIWCCMYLLNSPSNQRCKSGRDFSGWARLRAGFGHKLVKMFRADCGAACKKSFLYYSRFVVLTAVTSVDEWIVIFLQRCSRISNTAAFFFLCSD